MRVALRGDRMVVSHDVRIPSELSMFSRSKSFPICGDILRRLKVANPDIELSSELIEWMRFIKGHQEALEAIKSWEDDSGDERLYPYQRVGVRWLVAVKRGILADSQGLGKTVEAAVACARLRNRPLNIGIICNGSNISSWASHMCEWFAPGQTWLDKNRGAAIVKHHSCGSRTDITNYDNAPELRSRDLDILIVDEAHHIRNRNTQAFKVIKGLAKRVEYLFLLTATPTINADYDMWTLLHLCDPARFSSYWSHIFRFFDVSQSTFGLKIEGVKDSERDNLHRMISSCMLSRNESILNLPGMSKRVMPYRLGDEHRAIYNQMEEEWIVSLGDESVSASVKVAQITRLRQLSISPEMILSGFVGGDKIDKLVEVVRESDVTTVVFSMFEQAAEMVKDRLNQNDIFCETLTGRTRNRDDIIHRFGSDFRVLAATYGTGGESLTLTQATRVIMLDMPWHPAGAQHAVKRAHRIGQDKEVEVIAIKAVSTIEEHIYDIIRTKGRMIISDLIARYRNDV